MTVEDKMQALIAAAQGVADRALSDNELAERLLAKTNETIAEAAGIPIPAGVLMKAERKADGAIAISGQADPEFQGELDDVALRGVTGGATAVEYGLIAALIAVAVIGGAGPLRDKLRGKFDSVSTAMKR